MDQLLTCLGLTSCQDVAIGNPQLAKGISGRQAKVRGTGSECVVLRGSHVYAPRTTPLHGCVVAWGTLLSVGNVHEKEEVRPYVLCMLCMPCVLCVLCEAALFSF